MKRKFFSLFLVLCMVLSLMPATVFAAVTASVTVGGVVFSSTGEGDISYAATNASGTVTTEGATSENYNIKFENGTLTLKDAAITKDIIGYGGGISTDQGDLDLVLEGTSRIAVTGSGEGARGIYIFGDLSIRGDGELTINSHSDGIYVNGDLAISGGTVNAAATGMNNGLCALGTGGNINITGGTVNALGIGAGIYGAESVAVSGNATVTAQGEAHYGLQGGQYADNFSISGSAVVTAIGAGIDATALKAVTGNTTHIILAGADADSAAKQPERLLDSGNTYKYVQLQPGQPDPDYVMKVDLDGEGGNDPVFYESFVDGWNAAINGNTAATTVKLLADWTADENGYFSSVASDGFHNGAGTADGYTGSIRIPSGKTVALDLNGHTIDRNLKSEVANGYAIVVNGTLTLQDSVGTGTITGGCDSEAGGVSVYSGAFTMEGGSISGNKGAGVYVLRSGSKFIMKGGTIQNNSGYGVYYSSTGGRVNLSGTPVIKENTTGNLYLSSGTSVTIDTEGLETGADIGVSFSTWPDENSSKTVATGSSGTDAGYFHSDKTGYELYDDNSDSTVKLRIGGDGAEARWGVAGADGSVPSSWTRGTFADAVTYAECLRSGTAYIQLLSDVNNAHLYVSGGKAAVLDLNGKTLDRGLSGKAAVDGGCAITVEGGDSDLKRQRNRRKNHRRKQLSRGGRNLRPLGRCFQYGRRNHYRQPRDVWRRGVCRAKQHGWPR